MDTFGKRLNDHTVEFVRVLPGPIERIWAYLADSDKRGEWFAIGKLPANVGEPFDLFFNHSDLSPNKAPPPENYKEMDEKGHTARNILLKLEPPCLLAFTFGPQTRPGEISEVEFRLAPEGDPKGNKIRLTLTHRKIPDRAFAVGISGGWHVHLAILRDKAENRVPPAFWDVFRTMDGVYEKQYA